MRPWLSRFSSRYRFILGSAAILAVIAVFILAMPSNKATPENADEPKRLIIVPHPIEHTVSLAGTLWPGRTVNVAAPFDGTIGEAQVSYGDKVEAGAKLVRLDTNEISMRVRAARGDYLKAEQDKRDLDHWSESIEVAHARRAALQARLQRDLYKQKLVSAKALLDRGIIPREEVESLEQQIRTATLQADDASQDVDMTLARGSAENRALADLRLENFHEQLGRLEGQMAGAQILAPVAGIVMKPSTGRVGEEQATLQAGTKIQGGQSMLILGDTSVMLAEGQVDQIDISTLSRGEQARVFADGLAEPLTGRVTQISEIGVQPPNGSKIATFGLSVTLDTPSSELRDRLRVGMSCSIEIVVYRNSDAIVVPIEALGGEISHPVVAVYDPATGKKTVQAVETGLSLPSGIEITRGLRPGATIVLPFGSGVTH